jgi:23S rRNA pseudouridine1911/1915/1917 synthase
MSLNRGYTYRERIPAGPAGVLDHLARRHPHSSAAQWLERIGRGELELDGVPVTAATLLAPGQELVWHRPPWDEPEADLCFQVLHEDDLLVAVAKPRGLPTLPGAGFLEHTLIAQVRVRYPGANPMHRLGRETSGIVLFARTHAAGAALQAAWRGHRVDKRYRALGLGRPEWDEREAAAPVGPVPHPRLGTVQAASAAGKPALSRIRVLERRERDTLFEVGIDTGRPHQIRIHLAWAGHPLVGDPLYGPGGVPLTGLPGLPGDGGYFLHAEHLAFQHPGTGRILDLWAPPPPELLMTREISGKCPAPGPPAGPAPPPGAA